MTRHQSRKISRSRRKIQSLSPCTTYSNSSGKNPFAYLFQNLSLLAQMEGRTKEQAEKKGAHELKMEADKRSAKARQKRTRKKV